MNINNIKNLIIVNDREISRVTNHISHMMDNEHIRYAVDIESAKDYIEELKVELLEAQNKLNKKG